MLTRLTVDPGRRPDPLRTTVCVADSVPAHDENADEKSVRNIPELACHWAYNVTLAAVE